jgi:benzoyl-CoA reductase subunit BamC
VVTVSNQIKTKIVKEIKVNLDKCVACRACEVACSGFHANPKYSSFNPSRSRIRLVMDMLNDVYVPVRAGEYTAAECSGRHSFTIHGKEYSECSFCPTSCPARDLFKEPDSGLPLKCDMCEGEKTPLCVQVCRPGCLTYEEREEECGEEELKPGEMEVGLQSLIEKHGYQKVMDTFARLSKKG